VQIFSQCPRTNIVRVDKEASALLFAYPPPFQHPLTQFGQDLNGCVSQAPYLDLLIDTTSITYFTKLMMEGYVMHPVSG
jgi:hypothetical protein